MGYVVTTIIGDVSLKSYVWDEPVMIWPHKDIFTGKRLMPFTKVARARMKSPYGPISMLYGDYCAHWTTPTELIMQKLKGNA